MNLAAGDVLIAISFPRYAADAVHLTRYALDRGAGIIALTDSVASPLAPLAHDALFAQSAHPVLSSSNVAALLVIEALVTAFMVSNGENVEKAARLTDAISAYLVRRARKAADQAASARSSMPNRSRGSSGSASRSSSANRPACALCSASQRSAAKSSMANRRNQTA